MQFQTIYSRKNNQERKIHYKYGLVLLLCVFILVAGCDQTFEPLQENDKYHFSIYGTLDAAVDTQWIRIGVPRGNINETPNPTGITVTLKHLETGQSVVMQDSLFANRDLLNYWTTMPLVINNNQPPGFSIYIDGSVELADLQSKWYVLINPQTDRLKRIYTFTYRNTIIQVPTYGGAWYAFAPESEERGYIENNANAEFTVLHRQFYAAAGGPEWDENIPSIDDLEYFLDGTASNVENGLGYVVGTDSKWMQYKACVSPDSSNVTPCDPEEPFWR